MYFTYILYSKKVDRYYVGSCSDLFKRIQQHNSGKHKSKYTRKFADDWAIVWKQRFKLKTDAIKLERAIKRKKSRKYIEGLVKQAFSEGRFR